MKYNVRLIDHYLGLELRAKQAQAAYFWFLPMIFMSHSFASGLNILIIKRSSVIIWIRNH